MSFNSNNKKGAYYHKVDLHIHTPASKCYQDKNVDANAIVSECLAKGLEIIATTDHNDIEWLEKIQNAAKGKSLYVISGVEITAAGGHILALFDKNYTKGMIKGFLARIDITEDKYGKEDAIGASFEKVLNEIANAGGIAIAAHANNNNGILKYPQGQYRIKICNKPELLALELNKREDVEKFSKGFSQYSPKACIQGSDAHKLQEIGQRFTWLKMDEISFESIRQALFDYEVKIKYQWDDIQSLFPRIKKLSVNQGFFKGASFEFHPNLNCLLGGRGTGKSTVVEFLRYCFNNISNFPEIRADTLSKIDKLIGVGGKIRVVYEDENGEEKIVERNAYDAEIFYEEPPIIKAKSGEDTAISLRPIFFSQGEISRMTSSPIAQLELIDSFIHVSGENQEEEKLLNNLGTNAANLIESEANYQSLIADINDPELGKQVTKSQYDRLERRLGNPILSEYPYWESEQRFIKNILEDFDNILIETADLINRIDIETYFRYTLDINSPNYKILEPLTKFSEIIKIDIQILNETFIEKINARKEDTKNIISSWNTLFNRKKQEYEKAIEEIGEDSVRNANTKLRILKKRLDELEHKERQAEHYLKSIKELKKERMHLLTKLKRLRNARYEKRLSKAKEWEQNLEGQIKINIIAEGDKQDYIMKLQKMLHGSWIKDRDIDKIAQLINPRKLVETVLQNRVQALIEDSNFSYELVEKSIKYLKNKKLEELYDLEITILQDYIQIMFEVEPGKEKPLNELSVGTKSTIIVSLVMIEGNAPLIIDQPEDSLDTKFIYQNIVKKLREEKDKRQFIFTTYNPNVVVAGEAELSYVLDATAEGGFIESEGGLDKIDTNKLILLHLEGGKEAFKLRIQKYLK